MAFGGQLFIARGNQEPLTITEAIVTSERVFVKWTADGKIGQLEATSTDGILFRGEYHHPLDGLPGSCELTLFKSLHEHLLFGVWAHSSTSETGTWAFRLQTDVVRPNRATVVRSRPESPVDTPRETRRPAVQVEMTKPSGESVPARELTPPRPAPVALTPSPAAATPANTPAKAVPPAATFSNQLDHLLGLSSDDFAARDQAELEAILAVAPSSAVFKISRSAISPELRALAAAVIEKQRTPSDTPVRQPVGEPLIDPKALRAQQRRSSKHWKS